MAEVRKYVIDEYVAPAKKRGERSLTIGAQSVREGLDGTKPISLVCRAIDSTQFAQASGTTLLDRQGPPASDQVVWRFRL